MPSTSCMTVASCTWGACALERWGLFHVIEMVEAYHKLFPGVDISIHMGNSAEVLADLADYATDIAVLAGACEDPAFHTEHYASHAVILFAPLSHPLARYDSVPLSALQDAPLLQRESGSTTRACLEAALERSISGPAPSWKSVVGRPCGKPSPEGWASVRYPRPNSFRTIVSKPFVFRETPCAPTRICIAWPSAGTAA